MQTRCKNVAISYALLLEAAVRQSALITRAIMYQRTKRQQIGATHGYATDDSTNFPVQFFRGRGNQPLVLTGEWTKLYHIREEHGLPALLEFLLDFR